MYAKIVRAGALVALAVCTNEAQADVKTLYASGDIAWHKENGWYTKKGDASTAQDWEDGAIASFSGNLTADGDVAVYGIRYGSGNRVLSANVASVTSLGAGGLVMEANGPLRLYSKNSATKHTLKLTADQSWTCNGNTAVRTFWIDPAGSRLTSFTCDENVTLTLTEHFYFNNDYARTDVGFPGYIVVRDCAKYRQAAGAPLGAKRLTLDGPDAVLVVESQMNDVAAEVCLRNGASWNANGQVWPETVTLVADGTQTCRLTGMLRIPDGETFNVRVEEGASLAYSAIARHASGAIVMPTVSGAGTFVNKTRVVTDDPVVETSLTVNVGEMLLVAGNGLKLGTQVQLNGGEMRFVASATVASAIEVADASLISADANVVATLAGTLAVTTTNRLALTGPGVKAFTGDGTFIAEANVSFDDGTLNFTDATWSFGNKTVFSVASANGPFAVSNATLDAWCESMKFNVATCEGKSGELQLGAGSILKLGHGSCVQLGFAASSCGVLKIDGGHYYDRYASSQLGMGYGNDATGRVEFHSGTFAPASCLRTNGGIGEFRWTGGKWLFDNANCKSLVAKSQKAGTNPSSISFVLDGPECLMAFKRTASGNKIDTIDSALSASLFDSSWRCTSDGRLTLTNEHATDTFTFNVRHAFTNINLRVCGDRLRLTKDGDLSADRVGLNEWVIGPDPSDYATVCETGSFPFTDLRILAGGSFDLLSWRSASVRHLSFEADSTLALTTGEARGFAVSGTLSLPDGGTLNYFRTANVPSGALVTAQAVVGQPTFVRTTGSRRSAFRIRSTSLDLEQFGFVLSVR